MSIFNKYGRKADNIAREAFKEYKAAEDAYNKARETAREYPRRHGAVTAEYAANVARAEANLIEATAKYNKAKDMLQDRKRDIAAIRNELSKEINNYYCADPTKLDGHTIELLKSGVLNPNEYLNLMNKARSENNHTMERVIAKYASDAAEEEANRSGTDSKTASDFRAVSYMVKKDYGKAELANYDVIAECYRRTADNTTMIDKWDELTQGAVERL